MQRTPKVICVHHRLAGYSSHHYNEAQGFKRELARRGTEYVLLVNASAPASILSEHDAQAVFVDPTFHSEWSFEERSRRFLAMLHEHVDRYVESGDRVLVTIATQLEAHAFVRWLQELPAERKPWVVVLFLSDRWNRGSREEYERQIAEFTQLRKAIEHLTPAQANRVIFFTLTDLLAAELSGLLGAHVDVAPMPLDYDNRPHPVSSHDPAVPRVAILGGTRGEKGSYLIPDIVRACRAHARVEFLVHLTNNNLAADEVERLARLADQPGVNVISDAMTLAEYEAALGSADLALFPYERIPYLKRTSGVFGEAVAFGIPVVVTPGTWLAGQIEAGRAAGVISDDRQADSIACAIAACVAGLGHLQPLARSLSDEWRKRISLAAFVDQVEEKIAQRSLNERPRRWRFWQRRTKETPRLTADLWK